MWNRACAAALRDAARTLRVRRFLPAARYSDEAHGSRDGSLPDMCRPVGELSVSQAPAILDDFFSSDGLEARAWGTWRGAPADHAIIGVEIAHPAPPPPRRRRKWLCRDWDAAVALLRARM